MKRLSITIYLLSLVMVFSFLFFSPNKAYAGWVKGYLKSDGTYVTGYWRSNPNGLKYDNYNFDGDWSDAFNNSYFSPTRDYSSKWYTPSWTTQNDYWVGKSFYDLRKNYKSYDYKSFDYNYDFWEDPIYKYTPNYNYDYSTPYPSYKYRYPSLYDDYLDDLYDYSYPDYGSSLYDYDPLWDY